MGTFLFIECIWIFYVWILLIQLGVSAVAMFFMPESPYYLITKGKDAEALKTLQWLRDSENVNDALEELKSECKDQKSLGNLSYVKLLTDAVYLRPFLIVMALMFFQQFSGINAVLFNLKVRLFSINFRFVKSCQQFYLNLYSRIFSSKLAQTWMLDYQPLL